MANGGRIGGRNVPGVDGYSGVYSMREIADVVRAGAWIKDAIPEQGLLRRYKADNLALADNDPVSSWTDSSPAADHAVQATSGNRPVLKTGILNGRSVVRFDGSNDFLSFGLILNSASAAAHFFVVSDLNASLGGIMTTRHQTTLNGWSVRYDSSTLLNYYHTNHSPNSTFTITDQFNILEVQRDGLALTAGANGVMGSTVSNSGYNTSTAARTVIGADKNGTADFLNGDIAEIIIYDHVLSGPDRAAVLDYASGRYGITV